MLRVFAQIAQLVEQWPEEPRVVSSILTLGTTYHSRVALQVHGNATLINLSWGLNNAGTCCALKQSE